MTDNLKRVTRIVVTGQNNLRMAELECGHTFSLAGDQPDPTSVDCASCKALAATPETNDAND